MSVDSPALFFVCVWEGGGVVYFFALLGNFFALILVWFEM